MLEEKLMERIHKAMESLDINARVYLMHIGVFSLYENELLHPKIDNIDNPKKIDALTSFSALINLVKAYPYAVEVKAFCSFYAESCYCSEDTKEYLEKRIKLAEVVIELVEGILKKAKVSPNEVK